MLGAPRVGIRTGVGVGPSVERALLDVGEVVGHQVVTDEIAFLNRGPQRIGAGEPVQADGIARAGGEDFVTATVGIVAIDGGAIFRLARIDIRARADADIEFLALAIEEQRAGPVALAVLRAVLDPFLAGAGGRCLWVVMVSLDW